MASDDTGETIREKEKETPRNLLFRLQQFGSTNFPSLIPEPVILRELKHFRSDDEAENAKSEPPADEVIDLSCVWAVEFYTPSQAAALLRGIEKLG